MACMDIFFLFSTEQIDIFFSYFSQKTGFDISFSRDNLHELSWYDGLTKGLKRKLQIAQNKVHVVRFIDSLGPRTRITADILAELNLLNVETRVKQLRLNHVHKIFYNLCPTYLKENFVRLNAVHLHDTRSSRYNFLVPHYRSVEHSTFYYRGIADWNSLPDWLKEIEKPRGFKASLKKYLTEHHQETEIGDFFFYWLHNVFSILYVDITKTRLFKYTEHFNHQKNENFQIKIRIFLILLVKTQIVGTR